MAEGHPRALTAVVAGSLCALLAGGPVSARSAPSLLPNAVPAQAQAPSPEEGDAGVPLVVAVIPQNAEAEGVAARLHYVARQAADRSARFDVLRLTDALDPQRAKEREARAEEGRKAVAAAREAYDNLDTERSLKLSEEAMRAWSETDLTLHMGDLTQAWLMKIASLVANGETKPAREEISRLVAVNPDAQFSPNFFPPDELAHAQAVRKAAAAAEGTLEVRTLPAGGEVFVNGRFAGISPVTVPGLADAEHFVTVLKPGYSLAQARAKPGQTDLSLQNAELFPRYDAFVRGVARNPEGPGRDRAAKEFGEFLGADQVLVSHVEAPKAGQVKLIGLRLDVKDGHNLAYAVSTLPAEGTEQLQQADGYFSGLLTQDAPRAGGIVTHFPQRSAAETRKLAGYGLLGTGALIMAVGAITGASALGRQSEARRLAEARDARAFDVADSGRTLAVVADISWLVGLATAGAGGYLAFMPPVGPAQKKPAAASGEPAAAGKGADDSAARRAEERRRQEDEAKRKQEEERKKKRRDEDDLRNY